MGEVGKHMGHILAPHVCFLFFFYSWVVKDGKLTDPNEKQRSQHCASRSRRNRRNLEAFPAPASAWKIKHSIKHRIIRRNQSSCFFNVISLHIHICLHTHIYFIYIITFCLGTWQCALKILNDKKSTPAFISFQDNSSGGWSYKQVILWIRCVLIWIMQPFDSWHSLPVYANLFNFHQIFASCRAKLI